MSQCRECDLLSIGRERGAESGARTGPSRAPESKSADLTGDFAVKQTTARLHVQAMNLAAMGHNLLPPGTNELGRKQVATAADVRPAAPATSTSPPRFRGCLRSAGLKRVHTNVLPSGDSGGTRRPEAR